MKSGIKTALVVLAAGSGTRFGHTTNKVWLPLSGRRIISRSLVNASKNFKNGRTILVINPDDEEMARATLQREVRGVDVEIVYGGATRHESEYNALQHLAPAITSGEIEVVSNSRRSTSAWQHRHSLLRSQRLHIVTEVQFLPLPLMHARWTQHAAIQLCAYRHRKDLLHNNY